MRRNDLDHWYSSRNYVDRYVGTCRYLLRHDVVVKQLERLERDHGGGRMESPPIKPKARDDPCWKKEVKEIKQSTVHAKEQAA